MKRVVFAQAFGAASDVMPYMRTKVMVERHKEGIRAPRSRRDYEKYRR